MFLRGERLFCVAVVALLGCSQPSLPRPHSDGAFHVRPGESIQAALEAAAQHSDSKRVVVHAGTYAPRQPGQALVWFNRRHDGITLEAAGKVVLTAANPQRSDPAAASHPAIVNHVVYFGDGITNATVLRGVTVTGANGFVTDDEQVAIESLVLPPGLERGLFFYADGGGIKIFGRSYPTIDGVTVEDNYASPCGGGVSIEHRGFQEGKVRFRNCVFRNNRCQITGSAVDLLPGSSADFENCLFVQNIANQGEDFISDPNDLYNAEHGSGALTVFPNSRTTVTHCTFTANWNGVDDKGGGNRYENCIFWHNDRSGGISSGERYEMDILDGRGVINCKLNGVTVDLRNSIDPTTNDLAAPDPQFDERFHPQNAVYDGIGYRQEAAND